MNWASRLPWSAPNVSSKISHCSMFMASVLHRTAMSMLDMGNPSLDWVKLANGMGVEVARTATLMSGVDLTKSSFGKPALS